MGRIYLPLRWLRESDIDPHQWLQRPDFDPRLGRLVDRLVAEAEQLYARAATGVAELPVECRPAIHAARLMYAQIGREVQRHGGDSISSRAVVSARRKMFLLLQAITVSSHGGPPVDAGPALPEAAFLVDAVVRHDRQHGVVAEQLGESLLAREFSLALRAFERLERMDQRSGTV
jgi:phytoene synthase